MTHKRKKNRNQPKISRRNGQKIALAISILALVAATYWASRGQYSASANQGRSQVVATPTPGQPLASSERNDDAVRSLPRTLSPANFANNPTAAHAYLVAQQIPSVLVQQPCYCDCGRFGHRSLLDCYRTDHGAG